MIHNIVANRSSFYWPKLLKDTLTHSFQLQNRNQERYSESKWCSDIAKNLPKNWAFLNIFLGWFFLVSASPNSNAKIKMHIAVAEKLLQDWKWSGCNFRVKMCDFCRGVTRSIHTSCCLHYESAYKHGLLNISNVS